ncbi:hypothetical protein EKG40_31430 [Pseudomonas moorei]|nr:hypothetical protein EKG40_31430 [Pseudomonas moorei]
MFGFFKVNYEKFFSSADETHRYIYGDRSRTAEILGNEKFIEAWLSSRNVAVVSTVIRDEALNGDIPSLKQMIWVSDLYFRDAENLTKNTTEQLNLKTAFLQDRIMFCEKAISLGLIDHAYHAMVSCANLYAILAPKQNNITDASTRSALNGIIKYARHFIESGYDDPELISDAKELLKQYVPIAQLTNALNQQ